jgi:hypothetical protein
MYAGLESGIAILGVASTIGLAAAPPLFVAFQSTVGPLAWALPFLLVAAPAALMGGTLPLLLAAVRPPGDSIGRTSGHLYAANTAGAIVGALITVLAIVPILGIRGTSIAAAALNLGLALVALAVAARHEDLREAPRSSESPVEATSGARLAIALYALAGGIALGYEVVWTQVILQFLSTRAIAFAVVLGTYLLGLVIGSWLYGRHADRVKNRWAAFGLLIAGAGIAALATFALLGPWLPAAQESLGKAVFEVTGSRMALMCARFALAAGVVVLPPTLLLGAAFPAAAKLAVQPRRVGGDIGMVLAMNTAFGIAGTVVTGFLLVPALGLAGSLGALAFVAATIGAVAIARQGRFRFKAAIPAMGLVVLIAGFARALPRDRLATLLVSARGGDLVFYDESSGGTVAVIEQSASKGKFRRLYIQGVSNTGDAMPSLRYMRLQALIPLLVHPELIRSEERYDVINLEPPPPAALGVVNLYSLDFYKLARERLEKGGLLAQWWPIATQNDEDSQSLVRSMLDAFPFVTLWTTEVHEMMLIGSMEPLRLDFSRVSERFATPSIAAALADVGIETPADLLATYVTDRNGLEAYAGDALPVTDDRPRIEYASWIRPREITRVLPKLLDLREPPPVVASSGDKARIESSFRRLADFYEISLSAYSRDREAWAARVEAFSRSNEPNAYYDWFFGRQQ